MKSVKLFLFLLPSICIIVLTGVAASAQNQSVEIIPGKKIIYVDKIGLPGYVNVSDLLQIFPECIARGDELYSNFDIQYDGKSVGAGRDIFLFQTKLSQIEKIEISTSSVATQQNSFYSGIINLIPRKLEEGISGDVYLDASSEPGLMPSADINYGKEKLQLYGHADLEALWPYDYRTFRQTTPQYLWEGEKMSDGKYFQETANLIVKYDISDKDILKGWFVESCENSKTTQIQNNHFEIDGKDIVGEGWAQIKNYKDTTFSVNKTTLLNAKGEYSHKFNPNSTLTIFAGMESKPCIGSSANRQNAVDGQAKMTFPLMIRDGKKLLSMITGMNVSYKRSTTNILEGRTTYLSPYFTFQQRSDRWSTDVTFRYQYYGRDFNMLKEKTVKNVDNHDFIGEINTIWRMKDHHALKLSLVRNTIQPTEAMLYPDPYFDVSSKRWKIGNPDLSNAYLHTVKLEYMFDWQRNGHNILFNVNGGYIRGDGLIEERDQVIYENPVKESDKAFTSVYTTYENTGISNIVMANMSVIYSYNILTLAVSGNFFSNTMLKNKEREHCNYFNVGLTPIFNFEGDWMLSGRFIYNSAIERRYEMDGDCFLGQIKFAKRLGNWTLHLEFSDVFDNVTTDISQSGANTTEYAYDLYNRRIILGVSYRIGGRK
ncbi:MAG: outer membrane beta-barrel protein [Bacteroidales bacterium]|nr:outer membrane beta-barrel protein [Candidatus Cacconaster equi]